MRKGNPSLILSNANEFLCEKKVFTVDFSFCWNVFGVAELFRFVGKIVAHIAVCKSIMISTVTYSQWVAKRSHSPLFIYFAFSFENSKPVLRLIFIGMLFGVKLFWSSTDLTFSQKAFHLESKANTHFVYLYKCKLSFPVSFYFSLQKYFSEWKFLSSLCL